MRAYTARVVGVLDGQTVKLRLSFEPFGLTLDAHMTLQGIEVPELVGPELQLGLRARAALERLAATQEAEVYVQADPMHPGLFRGGLVVVPPGDHATTEPVDLASELMRLGYARPATSGAREPFDPLSYPAS